ncbi:MAG: ATP-dependent helicase DeaD [Chloroflexota bacterium]|nr:ATP-dependent helicase DeaD [Chloroflexota bacterium]
MVRGDRAGLDQRHPLTDSPNRPPGSRATPFRIPADTVVCMPSVKSRPPVDAGDAVPADAATDDPDPVQPGEPAAAGVEGAGFLGLGLDPRLVAALSALGYEEPTDVQREAIPPLLAGRNILAEAPTGTGKTAAFALPMVQRLGPDRASGGRPRALVLTPTRELAIQVAEAIHRYGQSFGMRVLPVYGGQAIGQQLRGLARGVDVLVATPGRAVDHLNRATISLEAIEVVVLDEADEMLDMGFAEDLEAILSATPAGRQTALFSATISPPIARIAKRHLDDPVRVRIDRARHTREGAAKVRQVAYVVRRQDKSVALGRILDLEDPTSTLVFARTRGEVDELSGRLAAQGHDTAALHGGMDQSQRDRVMGRFREGALDVLVATDVAARGLDIEHVSHVVNYDIPANPEAYIHRIGRTGRAGREGVAITLVEPREHRLLRNIEAAIRTRLVVAQIPTVADLRERRLEVLRGSLREAILADGLDRFRAVVEPLTEEFDVLDVALAAVSLAEAAAGRDGEGVEAEIAPASLFGERSDRPGPGVRPDRGPERAVARDGGPRRGSPGPGGSRGPSGPGGSGRSPGGNDGAWTRLWVGAGRETGVRPGDLVGSITNEAGVPARAIGAIQISGRFSIVEVAEGAADDIVRSMRGVLLRGKPIQIRRDREPSAPFVQPRGPRPGP